MKFLTNKDVQYLDKLWEEAKSSDLQDWQLKNVRQSEISWRYWKIYNNASEFAIWQLPKDRKTEVKKLYDDMVSLGIKQIREGGEGQYLSNNPDLSENPREWTVEKNGI
ncbi:hypothetical protein SDC9_162574 [bioreactor metagenome]|uniref:Uncharacterized protein n=1 Tax=bioreactor metagenome TaxID=1076179 RepID=A0A645FT23_9ZZZZ